jgi:hypothetical protein
MKVTEDYKHWLEGKTSLINQLIETDSLIFNRLEPVYNTLQYYKDKELNEQEFPIFDVGYMYLAEQVHGIENYISIFGSLEALEEQSVAYNYLMEMNDFYDDHDLEEDKDMYLELVKQLEESMIQKKPMSEEVYLNLEKLQDEHKETDTIVEIFEDIASNLGV